jgi:hypothetical protein
MAQRQYKAGVAVGSVNLHHVPKDGAATDLDKFLLGQRIAAHAGTLSAAENDDG